jgi:glutamate-1-semialdehyde 2,1-aminomutase
MAKVSPDGPVYQAGTLSGNPVAMAAGLAQLKHCASEGFYEKLSEKTLQMVNRINEESRLNNFPVELVQIGSVFWFSFNGKKRISRASQIDPDMHYFNQMHHFLLNQGVYFGPSGYEVGFVSTAHSMEDLSFAADQIIAAFHEMFVTA